MRWRIVGESFFYCALPTMEKMHWRCAQGNLESCAASHRNERGRMRVAYAAVCAPLCALVCVGKKTETRSLVESK